MRTGSLRLRLLAGTLAWMLLAIALVGWGLRALFQDHVTQQLQAQLVMQLDHLSASVEWTAPGSVSGKAQRASSGRGGGATCEGGWI